MNLTIRLLLAAALLAAAGIYIAKCCIAAQRDDLDPPRGITAAVIISLAIYAAIVLAASN